ncbi:uracil-DNA glycosylase-like protein [Rhodocollybia butyracea]|uniref:Uracil-DNA glycosylase n=1 Tax=Rhodocollybia butyracea TaxID=206335 RepID=A0A9P5UAA5_9AGAR|nr:uracil-DNA glycosylase-like protein [Rhodocollybia butyracea]
MEAIASSAKQTRPGTQTRSLLIELCSQPPPFFMPKDKSEAAPAMLATKAARSAVSTAKRTTAKKIQQTLPFATSSKDGASVNAPVELDATVAARLDALEIETMDSAWYEALKTEFQKAYFIKLKEFLATELKSGTVYPPLKDVYSWSRLTPLESVKVVILGQDPYHNVGQAHGLSFSVLPPTALPGSLKNIYKQMATDVPSFKVPTTGDLTPLAQLGVLWLNTSLTVRAHKAGSHSGKGWETLTAQAIKAVTSRSNSNGVVFMAWGLPAQKTCGKIGIDEKKHLVLRSAHPSPLSAYRGFLGNGHFKQANEWLKEKYGEGAEIDWAIICR